ncbi:hypothetical protein CTI16_12280 [Prevotella intermedia]|uniref:Uncharacterized protein n=1 Tax=Prevotella intermedia TaxID=28131 RepID=A0AAJ3RGM1_PREIN|nr:hypothetical protein CUB95_03180 [Prevotella intermedia]PIK16957.1 hypothetical protein CTI16_12280 [Prevotella intermedia]
MFCVPKAALLHGKSVGFALQKSRFRNAKAQLSVFNRIIFTKLNRKSLIVSVEERLKIPARFLLELISYTEHRLFLITFFEIILNV